MFKSRDGEGDVIGEGGVEDNEAADPVSRCVCVWWREGVGTSKV